MRFFEYVDEFLHLILRFCSSYCGEKMVSECHKEYDELRVNYLVK